MRWMALDGVNTAFHVYVQHGSASFGMRATRAATTLRNF
jgi:hypothetical protein